MARLVTIMHQRISERSILYSIPPIGVGSPNVESLSGYVARLANAHSVTVRTLTSKMILPVIDRPHLQKAQDSGLTTFWGKDSRALNGVAGTAADWVRALERLTLQPSLDHLTMLPLRHLLAPTSLLKDGRAWCPVCLQEQAQGACPVYEPLVWLLQGVDACETHAIRLAMLCPRCGRRMPTLGPHSRPGFCPVCDAWLGAKDTDAAGAADNRDVWIARAAGELVALGQTRHLGAVSLAEGVRSCVRQLAAGNAAAFSRRFEFPEDRIKTWAHGINKVSLRLLLDFSYKVGVTPTALVVGGHPSPLAPAPDVRLTVPEGTVQMPSRGRPSRTLAATALRQSLHESPAPSVTEVARRIGMRPAEMYRVAPDLARGVADRHRQERAEAAGAAAERLKAMTLSAVADLQRRGVYPSYDRVAEYLPKRGYLRHPVAQKAWRDALGREP